MSIVQKKTRIIQTPKVDKAYDCSRNSLTIIWLGKELNLFVTVKLQHQQ